MFHKSVLFISLKVLTATRQMQDQKKQTSTTSISTHVLPLDHAMISRALRLLTKTMPSSTVPQDPCPA